MKNGVCPKCAGEKVFEIAEAKLPNYEYADSTVPLTLTAAYVPTGKTGMFGDKKTRLSVRVSAYVCGACGYSELYAKDLEQLQTFSTQRQGGVRPVLRKQE